MVKDKEIEYKYMEALASIEIKNINKNKVDILSEKVALDKMILVEPKKCLVYFMEYKESVYCITMGSKDMESRIKNKLMHYRRKESEWGSIISESLTQYKFNKNFYYWILDKKEIELTDGNNKAVIIDVKGFKSDSERDTASFSGEGSHIDKRVPLMSILGMGENLVNLYVKMIYNEVTYVFVLHNDGRLSIILGDCGIFGSGNPKMLNIREATANIYFKIIPFLKNLFGKEVTLKNWEEHEKKIKRFYAKQAILKLVVDNGIKIEELITAIDKIV